ncbi:hypothetical protein GGI12_002240 [Dipsacomyces acuminosporus]|nr:hypothetical protein GGI12_002240 [Dipsacomyces acuminosporus]
MPPSTSMPPLTGSCGTSLHSILQSRCPSLTDTSQNFMIPTPYLFTGFLQTIYGYSTSRKKTRFSDIRYDRELCRMSDGGTIALDWYPERPGSDSDSQPVVVVLPPVGGTSTQYFIRYLVKTLAKSSSVKYRVLVINYRGLARVQLTSPMLSTPLYTGDIREVVEKVKSSTPPETKLLAIGFSMGANILTKYIGEEGRACLLSAGISICNIFDVAMTMKTIESPGLLATQFAKQAIKVCTALIRRNIDVIQKGRIPIDMDALKNVTKPSELDTLFSAKLFGFSHSSEFYDAASSSNYVDRISVPFLAVSTMDDGIAPIQGVPVDAFKRNPYTALALVRHGGHIALLTGLKPEFWFVKPVVEFFNAFV